MHTMKSRRPWTTCVPMSWQPTRLLFSVERGLRNIMNAPASGLPSGLSYLGEIGVSFSRDGVLTVDKTKVESALTNNFNAVSELFSTTGQGFANRLDTLVDGWLAI